MIFLLLIIPLAFIIYTLFMSNNSQVFGRFPFKGDTKEKIIALTFDDGPNEPYTSEIAEFLESSNIKATFFQVGKCVERFPNVTKKLFSAGHVIGNHSLSHAFHIYFTQPRFENEIKSTQEVIFNTIGKTPALFRPPWLWRQPLLMKTAKDSNLVVISGEFAHPLEVFQISGEKMANNVIKKIKPGSIIIFHDGFDARAGNRSQTVKAVKLVVNKLTLDGYKFVTIDNLLGINAYND